MYFSIPVSSALFFSLFFIALSANAATYYISPGQSLSQAAAELVPGDTLILRNGIYTPDRIDGLSGTQSQPITIKAENERMAHLKGQGGPTDVFNISNSSWLILEGFEISDILSASYGGSLIGVSNSDNLTIRRMLLHQVNWGASCDLSTYTSCNNVAVIQTLGSDNLTFEENQLYDFHRHGIALNQTPYYGGGIGNHIVRRNYCNAGESRGIVTWGGCVALYSSANNVIENNITENPPSGFDIEAAYAADSLGTDNNEFLGNIAYGINGFLYRDSCRSFRPSNSYIKDNVAIDTDVGFYFRGTKDAQLFNNTVIGAYNSGYAFDDQGCQSWLGGSTTFSGENNLVTNSGNGFNVDSRGVGPWTLSFSNSFGNQTNFYPSSSSLVNSFSVDPQMGSCKLWLPDNSPMKGAGVGGADIGANILYAYENGVLTSKKLWNTDGSFAFSGVIAPGVNDIPGSLFDIQNRLNINTNGCAFPAGY